MWNSKETKLNPQTIHFQLEKSYRLLSVQEVIDAWIADREFRKFYNDLLAAAPFPAFFWELPPIVRSDLDRPFEFVLVNSNALARVSPMGQAFRSYFHTEEPVVVFDNLGGDATLVVPTPKGKKSAYPHLGQFVRHGPESQVDAFWQEVGRTYRQKISDTVLWLSTSGLGVYWLHVRLDSYPKYYTHGPYRQSRF
ncbi:DUF6940 family protein [Flavilitoribacter nigricans]|uniref:Uncharacterized protein n=1 Tax=Flavilitoribacter nigricans (strain ATCC 23147 / DSM 23189 / NBRC 102662 / NCIMB 1420 / SS-2) TaxID=1122177 RepID=A0A2D0NA86_FLAN2|nr:hypothetical protein [Flavilitoribacter nigricans]PHN05424.1 hypothetical protein CRP01_15620 [Flavilitoribacter nigricans DSM 23189 = NBRC 102662]